MPVLAVINRLLSLKAVQWLLLLLVTVFLSLTVLLVIRNKALAVELKATKADLVLTQGMLEVQNAAVKRAGEEQKKLEAQKQAKSKEAASAKATAAERAAEIMRLKLSKDCKEVTRWGLDQALSQSHW